MDFKSVYFVQNKLICITLWRFVLMITCNMLTQKTYVNFNRNILNIC